MRFEPGVIPAGAKPFQPGQSGNPAGRAKGSVNLDSILNEMLEREVDCEKLIKDPSIRAMYGLKNRSKLADVCAALLVRDYLAGKKGIAKLLWERNSGRLQQSIDVTTRMEGSSDADIDARIMAAMQNMRMVDVTPDIEQTPDVSNAT